MKSAFDHIDKMPPELPTDGEKSHSVSSDFQHVRMIFVLMLSIFVSCTKIKAGS